MRILLWAALAYCCLVWLYNAWRLWSGRRLLFTHAARCPAAAGMSRRTLAFALVVIYFPMWLSSPVRWPLLALYLRSLWFVRPITPAYLARLTNGRTH